MKMKLVKKKEKKHRALLSLSLSLSSSSSFRSPASFHIARIFFFSSHLFPLHAAEGHPADPEHGLTTGPPNVALEQRDPCISPTMPLIVATGSAPAGSTLSPTSRSCMSGEHAQPVSTNARASVQHVSESVRPRRSTSPVSWEQSAVA